MNNNTKGFIIGVLSATAITSVISITQLTEVNNNLDKIKADYSKTIIENNELSEKHLDLKKELNTIIEERNYFNEKVDVLEKENKNLKKELARTVNFELTYYTDLPEENGGYTITSSQTPLRHGVVASNHYPVGTKISINGTVYTVEDTGSSEFDSPHRLDVLVERQPGESDHQYKKRVNDKGRVQVKGRIL